MKDKQIKQYLPFIVGYLGKPDYSEVAQLMKISEVDAFVNLERLVKKGKLKTEVIRGEVKYLPKEQYRSEDDE